MFYLSFAFELKRSVEKEFSHRDFVVCQYFPSLPFGSSHGDGLFITLESVFARSTICHQMKRFFLRKGGKFITAIFCELSLFMVSNATRFSLRSDPRISTAVFIFSILQGVIRKKGKIKCKSFAISFFCLHFNHSMKSRNCSEL